MHQAVIIGIHEGSSGTGMQEGSETSNSGCFEPLGTLVQCLQSLYGQGRATLGCGGAINLALAFLNA